MLYSLYENWKEVLGIREGMEGGVEDGTIHHPLPLLSLDI